MVQSDIVVLGPEHPLLPAVKQLGKANSNTLGFLPEGAFDERAAANQIIVAALPESAQLVGYLLYRVARRRAVIVHLCVDAQFRRSDLGRRLVDRFRKEVKHCDGIRLSCRRDYSATEFWPRCGFRVISEKPGRGSDGQKLTIWGEDFGGQTLFSEADDSKTQSALWAAIDMNVFLDLCIENQPHRFESLGLTADWLREELNLCVTHEVYNEINRHSDPAVRATQMGAAYRFKELQAEFNDWEPIRQRLSSGIFSQTSVTDESDIRHIAISIAGGAHFFVTRDTRLLDLGQEIEREFGIRVLRPSELIVHFDALLNEMTYAPERLAGSLIRKRPFQDKDKQFIVPAYVANGQGEKKAAFQHVIWRALSSPTECRVTIVEDLDTPLAITAIRTASNRHLDIQILRMSRNKLGATLGHSILLDVVSACMSAGTQIVQVSDRFVSKEFLPGLEANGFLFENGVWTKFIVGMIGSGTQLVAEVEELGKAIPCVSKLAETLLQEIRFAISSGSDEGLKRIERLMWPAKIRELDLPAFVIPIKSKWAMHLFDKRLANQELFGADPLRAMNGENVYYRSASASGGLRAPGRILWYCCLDPAYAGSASISACSYLDEVIVAKPKAVYARFKRLGIYSWADVFAIADRDEERPVMALRFSATELLEKPISLKLYRQVIQESTGRQPQFQSPFPISRSSFLRLYALGVGRGDQNDQAKKHHAVD